MGDMRLEDRVRSISYLKAHAAEIVRELAQRREPMVITQHGEARAVMLDVATFDQLQETGALLTMLSLADRQAREGMVQPADEAIAAFRQADG
jgi:prevent-host-death family protein